MKKIFKFHFKNDIIKIIILIVLIFSSLIIGSNLITSFTYNKKLYNTIRVIKNIKNDLKDFKLHYSNGNLPSTEVKNMNTLLLNYTNSLINLSDEIKLLNIQEKISLQSLVSLYIQKFESFYEISFSYQKILNDYNSELNDIKLTENLISNERNKLLLNENDLSVDYYKNRIDMLKEIKYNLSDSIFRQEAKKKLIRFMSYFSINYILVLTPIDKAIESKELEMGILKYV